MNTNTKPQDNAQIVHANQAYKRNMQARHKKAQRHEKSQKSV